MSDGVIVAVRVTPRSGWDAIDGVTERGELRIRVAAAPADGAANKAVLKLVAKTLRVPRGAISLVSGAASRHKRLRIEGVDATALQALWPGASLGDG